MTFEILDGLSMSPVRRSLRIFGLTMFGMFLPWAPAVASDGSVSAGQTSAKESAASPSSGPSEVYGPVLPAAAKPSGALDLEWRRNTDHVPQPLVDALELISQNYPSVRGAKAGLAASAADIRAAKWQRYPSLSVETSLVDSGNRFGPALAVTTPVWTGGRITGSINRAGAQFDASVAKYREVVLGLAVDAAQTYFDIARLARRRVLIEESLAAHGKLVASMERRVAQEVSPRSDLELAQSRYAQIEQELTTVKAQQQASLFAFAELIGDESYELGNVPEYTGNIDITDRDALITEALAYDPTIRRLLAEARAAKADVSVAKAAILPQINAQYSYNEVLGSQVGLVARMETSGGLSRFSAVDGARSRLEGILAQTGIAERQARQRIHNDLIEFDAAQARARVSLSASQSSERVSESYMRQFIAGRRSWLDVMNTLRETLTARLGLADAEISSMSTFVRLSLRAGRWSPFSEDLK